MTNPALQVLDEERQLLARVVYEHAAARPRHPFLYYGEDDVTISYEEFVTRADAVAGNLVAAGVRKGDRISVFLFNPMITTIWMFAIWRAGAVYCPINFSYQGRLLAYQLNDTRPRLVVTERALVGRLVDVADSLEVPPELVVYDAPEGAHDHVAEDERSPVDGYGVLPYEQMTAPAAAPDVDLRLQDPANVIYTSGTTGPAKGVLQPHRWINQYTVMSRRMTRQDDIVYSDLPMYHVGGAYANLGRGAWKGCTIALWDRFSPTDFWRRIRTSGASSAILLDVMIPWLMSAPPSDADRDHSLRRVHMQPLPRHHHVVASRFGFEVVTVGFGQTESGASASALIDEQPEGGGARGVARGASLDELRSIAEEAGVPVIPASAATRKGLMGRATPHMELAILDDDDEICPPEQPGHFAMRPRLAHLLMHEYLNKPEATVEAWRNLWFHTGDAALIGDDGMLYFIDRLGDRLRVRGENLSSFQVEDEVGQHPEVEMCAAFGVPSDEGDEDSIVVCFVATPGSALEPDELDRWCRESLPRFMRPRFLRRVDELPRTPTNKVEKYKLKRAFSDEKEHV